MAIFRLTGSQPSVFLLPAEEDQRDAAAVAAIFKEKHVPFHILFDGTPDEVLEPFVEDFIAEITDSPVQPHLVIDFATLPFTVPNRFLTQIIRTAPQTTFLFSTPVFTATLLGQMFGLRNIARVNLLPGFFPEMQTVEFAHSLAMSSEMVFQTEQFLRGLGLNLVKIDDIVGFVAPRLVAMLANEAAFAVLEGVSSPAEIDEAMRLGTNYPKGPLEWADDIGLEVVLSILDALYNEYKQERYRPCRLFRQYTAAGWLGIQTQKGFYQY